MYVFQFSATGQGSGFKQTAAIIFHLCKQDWPMRADISEAATSNVSSGYANCYRNFIVLLCVDLKKYSKLICNNFSDHWPTPLPIYTGSIITTPSGTSLTSTTKTAIKAVPVNKNPSASTPIHTLHPLPPKPQPKMPPEVRICLFACQFFQL